MSEIKSEDPGSAPQPIHVIPSQHRVIPQAAVAPQLVTVHNQFQDAPVEPPVVTATAFQARPKPTRFPLPFHDASSSLTTLTAAVTQLQSTMVHSFSTSSVTNAAPHMQRPPSGITQVLAAGLISQHQGHAPSPQPSNPMQTQQQQHQFQKLKVEDALSYLDQVKFQFGNQPQVYNDFLDIMKEFKSQSIDTPGVIARVSHLFNGHPDLIVGFNTFLPPGYKIEVSANDQVNVTGPNMVSQTIHPLSGLMEPSQQSSTTIQVNVHTPHGKFATTLPQLPTHRSSPAPPPGPPSGAQALQNAMFPTQRSSLASSTASGPNTNTASNPLLGAAPINQPQTTGVGGQPVEFNHAINYVNKIKNRFQGQPDIYKAFLEILHKYQKEQRNVKDSNGSYVPSLSESEVYSQVARLFQNDEDLLREFGQFLPDAGGAVSSGSASSLAHASTFAASPASNPQKGDSVMNDHGSTVKKQPSQSSGKQHRSSAQQAVKRVAQPATHMPSGKRAKSSSLKDVSISEASKCGSLSEFAFFDKVRRALHSQEAYDNFLRCLLLYNNEVVGREELIRLVQPFFMKFTELFSWLKKFLGHKDVSYAEMESDIVIQQQTKEKHEGMAMEIDYRTLKRLGSSYRLLPHGFTQPRCTGRDALCHEVLNDTLVSFPSWSEDSQSVTSRKTPFEEHMYRCEDERYQLDVVIETNLGAIRSLEAVNKKLSRMSDDDKAKFRLDNYLGGTSEVTQRKAIHRIYGDKAPDMIEGLKKNPGVAVPLVLKRLKLKDDEWREAQLQFNKVWRSQCEKYYLKSLDHQGIGFKANDTRFIRSKSLLNEIETAYDERQESTENNGALHHMTLEYEDKGIMDDAASLIIHHAKRQSGINKDDKQKVRQVMHQVLPDLYFAPRGNQPSDDEDDDDDEDTEGEKQEKPASGKQARKITGETPMDDNPDGRYHLFLGNNNFYLFFRLHFILCERLLLMSRRCEMLAEEELKERKSKRGEAVAEMLQLRHSNEIEPEEYYPSFLDMVRNLLDGNVDSGQYEDTLREMFTIHAYHAFTMDKLVQNIVRQLQHIVQDEACVHLLDLYHAEASNQATGGLLASQAVRSNAEAAYQRKAEHLSRGENCFKFTIGQKLNHLHVDIELLDTDKDGSLDLMEVATWSEYLDNYVTSDDADVTRQMKERLGEKPVFLQRNANHLRRCAKNSEDEDQSLVVRGCLESKIQTGSYKLTFVPGSGDFTYRLGCFSAARKAHPLVSEQLHARVRTWLGKWEDENVSRDMARQTNHWLMGKSHGLVSQITTIQTKKAGKLSRNFYQVRLTEA